MIGIGLPRRTVVTAPGPSTSVMVPRTTPTSVRAVRPGFVLFALFNYLPIYLFTYLTLPRSGRIIKGEDIKN